MKRILSIFLALILATSLALPAFAATAASSPDCVTITVDTEKISCVNRIINSIIALFKQIFNWLFGWFRTPGPGPEPPIEIPTPTDPEPQPPEEPPITATDPNENVPNGFPVSGSLDHSATTREVAYELIYDYFKDTVGFNPGNRYVVNETNNVKVNKAVNYILENNTGEALVYIGINQVSDSGTRVNICPDSPVTGAFLEGILFSIPIVSQIIVLNEDQYAPLSKEQVEFIIQYTVIYTRIRNGNLINSDGTITRQKAYEQFANVFSDIGTKKLVITDPDKPATIEYIDYLAKKFSGSVSSQYFGEPDKLATSAEVQFTAELNKLMMYSLEVCYNAE